MAELPLHGFLCHNKTMKRQNAFLTPPPRRLRQLLSFTCALILNTLILASSNQTPICPPGQVLNTADCTCKAATPSPPTPPIPTTIYVNVKCSTKCRNYADTRTCTFYKTYTSVSRNDAYQEADSEANKNNGSCTHSCNGTPFHVVTRCNCLGHCPKGTALKVDCSCVVP